MVSAHYPPNFTSGGTLQPRRLARGLRDRGHDVSVFAGWLGDRPPLSTWAEEDETGLPIRWITVTPWTGWDDPRNFDNPEVAAAFAAHLAEVRPDIVHLHSIQTLGVGLVEAARAAGARVVVTMHDFWWICSRQFLVDRAFHPCSEVVDLGTCQCEQGRAALDARNARLAEAPPRRRPRAGAVPLGHRHPRGERGGPRSGGGRRERDGRGVGAARSTPPRTGSASSSPAGPTR